MPLETTEVQDPLESFDKQVQAELEQSRQTLSEISLLVEQSQTELAKLNQKNSTITGRLAQVQSQFETMPRADIKNAYNSAMDAQQRVLVMRGQLEKLQSDVKSLQHYIQFLEAAQRLLVDLRASGKGKMAGRTGTAVLELVINAQEAERARLSRQMHDGPAQALSNFIVQAEITARLFELDPIRAKEGLEGLKTSAMSTFQKVRTFIFDLRPMMLDDLGVFPTIRRYVETFKEQTGLEINLVMRGQERRLEPYLEVMIFRSLQELLANAAEHNEDNPVKVKIDVSVLIEENLIRVAVSDNGKGFDADTVVESGIGLKLIRERVEMVGGYLEIDAALNQGAKVTFQVPCLEVSTSPYTSN